MCSYSFIHGETVCATWWGASCFYSELIRLNWSWLAPAHTTCIGNLFRLNKPLLQLHCRRDDDATATFATVNTKYVTDQLALACGSDTNLGFDPDSWKQTPTDTTMNKQVFLCLPLKSKRWCEIIQQIKCSGKPSPAYKSYYVTSFSLRYHTIMKSVNRFISSLLAPKTIRWFLIDSSTQQFYTRQLHSAFN